MTSQEIIDRLKTEGITPEQFVFEHNRPEWLGKVECVDSVHKEETMDELEHIVEVFSIPEHNVYLRAHATKEDGEWDFWEGLRETFPRVETVIRYY